MINQYCRVVFLIGIVCAEIIKAPSSSPFYNVVTECGAYGNGENDDTNAIANCTNLLTETGGVLYFPPGNYLLSRTIYLSNIVKKKHLSKCEGWASTILWTFDANVFEFSQQAVEITIEHLRFFSTNVAKSKTSAAMMFTSGLVRSFIFHVLITSEGNANAYPGSGIISKDVTDTTTFRDCLLWQITGTGIQIGYGSEVRIAGGRIIGIGNRHDGSIGIHVTGNNGGVHVDSTDVIGLETGLLLDMSNGQGSNREIFITQATFDSDNRGIAVNDSSYISVAGLWAASSDTDQIWVAPGQSNPLLVIAGGTIFNGGVYGGNIDCTTQCNGITVNSGSFSINGVDIRNNQGKGIWVPNGNVNNFVITGNKIFDNNVPYLFINPNAQYLFTNNICNSNGALVKNASFGTVKADNLGC
ncbi:hypothetical protein RFI_14595 [Reticulomyxa filosa]|uniref:Rhamnogalacturonase A/B/Epimerase-like pectate lyase domain-containing protein n=1 Tax=Reticulomyxa filosa TaxID=46433 RepID=X6N8J0_RETFI|nr:hypothetical protein RFI_14595 [Reticulomyxa filosa]|eukprot:ETO22600.1 hypothetical protein RFI_14595 [Reticulomyxa filosa]